MTVLSLSECELAWESPSPAASLSMGERWAACFGRGIFAALFGELGSGKTLLVRGVAAGLGCVAEDVHSPSFTLVNEYPCRRGAASGVPTTGCALAHIDLYRIRSADEVPGIGWDEYMGARYVVLVEWAERAAGCLPKDHLRVRPEARVSRGAGRVQATGPRAGRVLRGRVGQLGVRLQQQAAEKGPHPPDLARLGTRCGVPGVRLTGRSRAALHLDLFEQPADRARMEQTGRGVGLSFCRTPGVWGVHDEVGHDDRSDFARDGERRVRGGGGCGQGAGVRLRGSGNPAARRPGARCAGGEDQRCGGSASLSGSDSTRRSADISLLSKRPTTALPRKGAGSRPGGAHPFSCGT